VHFCERDSSGTTEPPTRTSGAQAVKVMERIARREECEARRSGSPNEILLRKIQLKMKN
jgi:hypothetical protein